MTDENVYPMNAHLKTVKRAKNQARLVITLELQVNEKLMDGHADAVDALREFVPIPDAELDGWRKELNQALQTFAANCPEITGISFEVTK